MNIGDNTEGGIINVWSRQIANELRLTDDVAPDHIRLAGWTRLGFRARVAARSAVTAPPTHPLSDI